MSFLKALTREDILTGRIPLRELLHSSLYYPSCGFDGGVVKDCNRKGRHLNIISFVYCDYATGEVAFRSNQDTFLGYHIFGDRSVRQSELTPDGWTPVVPPAIQVDEYLRYKDHWKPFIHWTVYERDKDRGDDHGPERFSVLYLGGEGVATYQALYWTNKQTAKILAIIQPGTAFGLNWTDFRCKNGALAWVVNSNPSGAPEIVYYGGYGCGYDDFDWDDFCEERIISPYYSDSGEVRLWQRTSSVGNEQ